MPQASTAVEDEPWCQCGHATTVLVLWHATGSNPPRGVGFDWLQLHCSEIRSQEEAAVY